MRHKTSLLAYMLSLVKIPCSFVPSSLALPPALFPSPSRLTHGASHTSQSAVVEKEAAMASALGENAELQARIISLEAEVATMKLQAKVCSLGVCGDALLAGESVGGEGGGRGREELY